MAATDEAGPVRKGEELDVPRLEAFLLKELDNTEGPLTVEQFPSGFSNLTYLLRLGAKSGAKNLVLRRPPFGNPVKTAHDMGREYRVLAKLCEVYELAPRPYLYCQDHDLIGDEFYVMERRHGVVLRGPEPPAQLQSTELAHRLCESFIANLARLHTLDYRAAGLGDLGKPTGYVQRQVTGWSNRYVNAATDNVPEIVHLAAWLADHMPTESGAALIHNDYKYDNLLLDPEDITHIRAVFDWEMTTIGDPLMDLGSTLAYWVEPADSTSLKAYAFGPTMVPGSMSRRDLVSRYVHHTGCQAFDPLFYYCYGLFKLAVIVQQIYARFVRGLTHDTRFAELNRKVKSLGVEALRAIETGSI